MSMKAVVIHEYGDTSKLRYEDVSKPRPPVNGEVLVQNQACGVNFLDVVLRQSGDLDALPKIMGVEASGVVESVGDGVSGFKAGDRVAYVHVGSGAFAEYSKVPANKLVPVPKDITLEQATIAMAQGMTANYLVNSIGPLQPGDNVLIHAVAGGTGSLLCQTAKLAGAFVIGTCSTQAKADKAKAAGADEVILYSQDDFVKETMRITDGKGVRVVYDSVGKDTFLKGFDCLATRGIMVSYGMASGPPPAVEMSTLGKGSFTVIRPSMFDYTATKEDLFSRSNEVFNLIRKGALKFEKPVVLPLCEVRKAFEIIEGRRTTGKIILVPQQE